MLLAGDAADKRVAVGMRPARGETEHRVARRDRTPVDDALLLDHANAEAREVVFPLGIHAGHLGGLAADKRAAGELAALGDALHHLGRDFVVELAAGEVIEEEERLGALAQHVVHAHGDEIDAHRVMTVQREGKLQLGAEAVGA